MTQSTVTAPRIDGADSDRVPPAGACDFASARIGTLIAVTSDGQCLVDFPGNPFLGAIRARRCIDLAPTDVEREIVLWFEGADPAKPLIMGSLRTVRRAGASPIAAPAARTHANADDRSAGADVRVAATDRLTIQCGRASITLLHDGSVLINGDYVESRASGTNRLQGGSVRIN